MIIGKVGYAKDSRQNQKDLEQAAVLRGMWWYACEKGQY
jgi:hypothetical protein